MRNCRAGQLHAHPKPASKKNGAPSLPLTCPPAAGAFMPLRCRAPGERLQVKQAAGKSELAEGVSGLTKGPARTGVRELTYRLAFIANGTQVRRRCRLARPGVAGLVCTRSGRRDRGSAPRRAGGRANGCARPAGAAPLPLHRRALLRFALLCFLWCG